MDNYQSIIELTEELSGLTDWPTRIYIKITNDPILGLFLDRIVWASDSGWFSKSADEWKREIGFSYAQVTRARKDLVALGFIQTKTKKMDGFPTLHYLADMEAIKANIFSYLGLSPWAEMKRAGCVYLIKNGTNGLHKIGLTRRLTQRFDTLSRLQPSSELTLIHTIKTDNMYRLEAQLHLRFQDKRIEGEWFDLNNEDVAFILSASNEAF